MSAQITAVKAVTSTINGPFTSPCRTVALGDSVLAGGVPAGSSG